MCFFYQTAEIDLEAAVTGFFSVVKSISQKSRYPVCIDIGDESGVEIDYSAEAWMTSEDVAEYCMVTVLPLFLEEAQKLIDAHNIDVNAHFSIRNDVTDLDARLSLLELMFNTEVTGNPFTVTFETLDGVTVEGVWNTESKRIEF